MAPGLDGIRWRHLIPSNPERTQLVKICSVESTRNKNARPFHRAEFKRRVWRCCLFYNSLSVQNIKTVFSGGHGRACSTGETSTGKPPLRVHSTGQIHIFYELEIWMYSGVTFHFSLSWDFQTLVSKFCSVESTRISIARRIHRADDRCSGMLYLRSAGLDGIRLV